METDENPSQDFTEFVQASEPKLRFALAAALGQQQGREATAEALAYGWEHWGRIREMENPIGYLYRVGRTRGIPRRRRAFAPAPVEEFPHIEPKLPAAVGRLSERQRVAVVLVHGFGWTRSEVADMLGISVSAVNAHVTRALGKLRSALGVTVDV